MFTSYILSNKCFRKMKHARLWKNVILWAISRREISPLVVIFWKKLINLHEGLLDVTTNISSNRVHPKMFDSYRDSLLTTLLTSEKKLFFSILKFMDRDLPIVKFLMFKLITSQQKRSNTHTCLHATFSELRRVL